MDRRDENQVASLGVAGFALVMLLALAGALFLPPGIISALFTGKVPFYLTLFAAFIGVPFLLRLAQRNRIRNAVEELGGQILQLKRLPFWRQGDWPGSYQPSFYGYAWWRGGLYEVEFLDSIGATQRAVCRSGFLRGVQWLEQSQPKGQD
jgi:hypothetical protein